MSLRLETPGARRPTVTLGEIFTTLFGDTMTRASGNSAASMASVLSVDASSTTTSSLSGHV